ncbi:MAG: TolC family protein [Calothrix sp. CSU_2_0]|nr:TolC family protein [Calothrix sp. CSU_2_0]
MNFYKFLLHSSWIAFAPQLLFWSIALAPLSAGIALFIPTSAQSAEAKDISVGQKNLDSDNVEPAQAKEKVGTAAELFPLNSVSLASPQTSPVSFSLSSSPSSTKLNPHPNPDLNLDSNSNSNLSASSQQEKKSDKNTTFISRNSPNYGQKSGSQPEGLQHKKNIIRLRHSPNSGQKAGSHPEKLQQENNSSHHEKKAGSHPVKLQQENNSLHHEKKAGSHPEKLQQENNSSHHEKKTGSHPEELQQENNSPIRLRHSPHREKKIDSQGEKQPHEESSSHSQKKSGSQSEHQHKTKSIPVPPSLLVPTKPEEVQIQENQPLTLEQALEIARNSNPQLRTAILELERSRAGLREAEAALYPTFGINGSLTNGTSAQDQLSVESGAALPAVDKARTAFTGQAEINYNIFTSGRRSASIREAKERARISELDVETRFQEIRLSVTTRYYDLQAADEQLRISTAAVENAQASLRDAQALERAGVGTKFDVLRSQVNVANSQQDYVNARSRQQISQRQLVSLLNLPQTVNISTAESVKVAGLWQQSLEETIINAYQNREELEQRLAERNIGEQRRRFALSQLGPQVALVATYDLLDQYSDKIGATDGYSVGVKAKWNIFDGGAARAQASQAKANIAIAESNFTNQRNQIRFEVEQFYAQLQSNLENVQTATASVDQALEALRLARLRFQAGVGTQTDVIAAENDLTRAQGNRVTAILDYNRAFANLQRAVSVKV